MQSLSNINRTLGWEYNNSFDVVGIRQVSSGPEKGIESLFIIA